MTEFIRAAFGERELVTCEIEGLTDLLRDSEIPQFHRIGATIRINILQKSLANLDAMIARALIEMDIDTVITDIHSNLSVRRN